MRYDTRLGKSRHGGARSTLWVSSQFCPSGTMGFKSNLSCGEIVEQLVHASRIWPLRNVLFMGMGEPLNNYTALVEAVNMMTGSPFQLSPKRITISTVGIIHGINKIHHDLPGVNLAVSLHAPVEDIRRQIMPAAARAFPLDKLMRALKVYQENSRQKILIEYIMLDGVNDEERHANQLGELLETFQVVVNLIPFNRIGSSRQFKTSRELKVWKFQKILRHGYNIRTTVRDEMGQDISNACGKLVVNLPNNKASSGSIGDIEDLHLGPNRKSALTFGEMSESPVKQDQPASKPAYSHLRTEAIKIWEFGESLGVTFHGSDDDIISQFEERCKEVSEEFQMMKKSMKQSSHG